MSSSIAPFETKFDAALAFTLNAEGGWSDDPDDLGGATMKGITQRIYDFYRNNKRLPLQSVRFISDTELRDIYQTRYWNLSGSEALDWPLCLIHFDTFVNCLPEDTAAVLSKSQNNPLSYLLLRIELYRRKINKYPALKKFFEGWVSRCIDLFQYC